MNFELTNSLGVMIMAAAVFLLLGQRLRLPGIVIYLITGLILGPITGIMSVSEPIQMLTEAGIVLLLFLVGLEMNIGKVKEMGKSAVVVGILQIVVTAAISIELCYLLGFSWVESTFLAGAMTFSSTVVAIKLLDQRHETDSRHGQLSIGVLLIQDIVVIAALTLLTGLQHGGEGESSGITLGLLKAFGGMIILMVIVGACARFVLPAVFKWGARDPQTLFIWSISWCFLVVMGAHAFHLSHEVGAFLAGLSLAQLPYNRDMHRRVHPLMSFFIAVFFVSLGIQMKLGEAFAEWPVAVILCVFALVIKVLIIVVLAKWSGVKPRVALKTGVTLGQISEFSFILVAMGQKDGLLDSRVMSLVGLVGLVSMAISAILIINMDAVVNWMQKFVYKSDAEDGLDDQSDKLENHIIVIGMNSMGRRIVVRLLEKGERVLAIDTDSNKLAGLSCPTLLGSADYPATLEEAGLHDAKLVVSALQIEDANELLAFRCRQAGIPSSINVPEMGSVESLVEQDVRYIMMPKIDGMKAQNDRLRKMGILTDG